MPTAWCSLWKHPCLITPLLLSFKALLSFALPVQPFPALYKRAFPPLNCGFSRGQESSLIDLHSPSTLLTLGLLHGTLWEFFFQFSCSGCLLSLKGLFSGELISISPKPENLERKHLHLPHCRIFLGAIRADPASRLLGENPGHSE